MAEAAKAAGVMVNFDTGEVMLIELREDDGTGMDPLYQVETLWKATKDDWPGWQAAFMTNDAGAELAKQRRLWQVLGPDEAPDMAERIEAHNAEVEARRAGDAS